jgi:oxaloacetate decarboxylase alpha subunit
VLDEVQRVRTEIGLPPLAAPLGQIVGSQALVNVLGASRYATILDELRDLVLGRFGRTPAAVDPALMRAVELWPGEPSFDTPDIETLRIQASGLASSEEDLLLLALFGEEAEPLLRSIRARAAGSEQLAPLATGDADRDRQIRAVVQILQETGVGEISLEEDGIRISVRSHVEQHQPAAGAPPPPADALGAPAPDRGLLAIESPMVGTFYRRPRPDAPPFVEEGEPVTPGQVLCILEAMKLMNEVKAEVEAIVRAIHVGDGDPVEYGQLLFELEPVGGRPVGV